MLRTFLLDCACLLVPGMASGADPATPGKVEAQVNLRPGATMPPEWPAQIAAADRALFDAVFTQCDADRLATMVSEDLEFFHDKDGLSATSGAQFVAAVRGMCERQAKGIDFRARRELVPGTTEIYPLAHYGAIEIGVHRFYAIAEGKPDRLTETARFTHVWKQEQGQWKLARVLSYDHRLAQ